MRGAFEILALASLALGAGDAERGEAMIKAERLTFDTLDKIRPEWSPDGSLLTFARHEPKGGEIYQYVVDGATFGPLRRLTDRKLPEYHGVFAPDGRSLLLVTVSQQGTQGNLDISRIDLDGKNLVKLAGDHDGKLSHQEWPAWSPDGSRFAFSSTHEGNQEIYVAQADGSALARLTQSPGTDAHPCWTPDGGRIVFTTDRWGGFELASMSADGSDLKRLTRSRGIDDYAAVSPGGDRIAFMTSRTGNYEIYVCSIDGSDERNISDHPSRDTFPVWSRDGRSIVFVSDRGGDGADLYRLRVPDRVVGSR